MVSPVSLRARAGSRLSGRCFRSSASAIFSSAGVLQIFAVALIQYLVGWLPGVGALMGLFIYVSYYFRVIASAAQGAEKLPEPDDFLGYGSMVGPVFRFFLASMMVWLPAGIYFVSVIGFEALLDDPGSALSNPVLVLLLIGGLCYFPAAIIAAAIAESALAVINPLITVRLILRIPGDYALATVIWAVLTVLNLVLMHGLELASAAIPIPIVTPILIAMIGLVIPIFTGFILGRVIYQNHEHFGIMRAGEAEVAEWPDAVPSGVTEHDKRDAAVEAIELGAAPEAFSVPVPIHPAAIDLESEPLDLSLDGTSSRAGAPPASQAAFDTSPADGEDLGLSLDTGDLEDEVPLSSIGKGARGPAGGHRSQDLRPSPPQRTPSQDLRHDPGPTLSQDLRSEPAPPPDGEGGELGSALDRGDEARAYEVFRASAGTGHYPALDARQNLRLAGMLERLAEFDEAVRACQRAAKADMKGPFAPKAIFTAARILGDRAGNAAGARAMYDFLLKNFPGDELAARARDALQRMSRD